MEEEQQQQNTREEVQPSSVVDFSSLESKLDSLLKLNEKIYNADEKERQQIQKEKDEQQKKIEQLNKEQEEKDKENATLELKRTSEQDTSEKELIDDTNKFRNDVLSRFDTLIKHNEEIIFLHKIDFVFSSIIIAVILILILSNTCFKK
ncbi:hypothetical protein C4R89_00920 [Clostridioides difficile]|nr:hypothetical protein [Clostridioides difficile]MDB0438099.1 hypothetical protein [Clostridioides difficile]